MADIKSKIRSISEYKCAICLELLIEPVVLPCKHEMCRPCFRANVEKANFVCPICRKRIASWTRKCMREGTLVDQNRWNLIQKLFPKKCLKRLQGDDGESEDESYEPPLKRVLAKSGELRQEYEQELNKILEMREKEDQASQDLIKKILEEEQEQELQQEKADEQLARKLSGDFKHTEVRFGARLESRLGKKDPGNSSNDPNNNGLDKQEHKSDYDLALALQKQFDRETVAPCKRDDYMLRKSTLDNNHGKNTQKNAQHKSDKQKIGHSYIRGEEEQNEILQVNGENTSSDEKRITVGKPQLQSKETRILRDRTIFTGTTR